MGEPVFMSKGQLRIAKATVSVGLFAYCLSLVDFERLSDLALEASLGYLGIGAALVLLETALGGYRFKLLFDNVCRLNLRTHVFQYFSAGYFNLFLPSSMGGDAARVIWLAGGGVTHTAALTLIVIERLLGVYSLVIVSIAASWIAQLPRVLEQMIHLAAGAALLALIVLYVLYRATRTIRPASAVLNEVRVTTAAVIANRRRLIGAFIMSLAYQALTVALTYLVVLAFALQVPSPAVFALVPLVWFATFVPITIGGLGVREASFIFLFAPLGVDREAALLMALGTYALFLFAGIIGGAWFTRVQWYRGE